MAITLDSAELEGLAQFCARRFRSQRDRNRFAQGAGLRSEDTDPADPVAGWLVVLHRANARGNVPSLVWTLAEAAPFDENLQQAARILRVRRLRWPAVATVGLGAVVLALAVGGIPWRAGRSETESSPALAAQGPGNPESKGQIEVEEEEAPTVLPVAAPPRTEPAVAAPSPMVLPVAAAPETSQVAEPAPTAAVAPVLATAGSGCVGTAGSLAGFWYAGGDLPGAVGDTITLARDVRVRVDYPRRENGNDARTEERCVLRAGTRLTLSQAPIPVAGGRYWVPYVVGDRVD
jgi:hypothetical protein